MLITEREKYIDLLNDFPPRPIKSEEEFRAVQDVVDSLLDLGKLSSDQKEYLNLLGMIIHDYEARVVEVPDIFGVELLNVLIEEWDLKQKELVPIFKTESIVSAVLNGHRQLTVEHIQKLAEFFHVSPAVFFPNFANVNTKEIAALIEFDRGVIDRQSKSNNQGDRHRSPKK
jgi:HTH-type transcriptional regulator / antitoxin HigA